MFRSSTFFYACDENSLFCADNYRLPPLTEVETFVRQHRHLPDVPSEADVLAEGQDLGEMNKLLLKKVEELTLYLIDQQRQLDALRVRVAD